MNTSLVRPVCWLRRFSFRGASVLLPQMGCTSSKPKVDEGSVTVTLPPDTPSSSDRPWDQTVRRGEGYAEFTQGSSLQKLAPFAPPPPAKAEDEHAQLRAYLEKGQRLVDAQGPTDGVVCPLRGSGEAWLDSDTLPSAIRSWDGASVLSVHCSTEAGTRSGGTRPNQDAFGVVVGVTDPRFVLATLLDGHGAQGHFLARHVRDRLPAWVASCVVEGETPRPSQLIPDMRGFSQPPPWMLRAVGFLELDAGGELRRLSEGLPPPDFPPSAAQLAAAFLLLDADMCNRGSALLEASRVTCLQSGCAAVAALVGDGTVAVASCGDSSAYLAIEQKGPPGEQPRYSAAELSVPHKASGDEAVRLRLQGGRVAAAAGEGHIPRVWPRDGDVPPGRPVFGLAVSRSFGDAHWKSVGVCASPDVVLRRLQPSDAFLLLCSDGVTDVMPGQRSIDIAAQWLYAGAGARNAAQAVVDEAKRLWAERFSRSPRDDISVVCILLRTPAAEHAEEDVDSSADP